MPNPRDQRLAQLAAIAQLFDVMNRSEQRGQESQQQDALARLGLTQQSEHNQALLAQQQAALAQQGQWHQDELAQKQASEANRSGEFWGQQKMVQDNADREFAGQQNNSAMKAGMDAVNQQRMMQQQMLQGMTQIPGMTGDRFAQMGSAMGVEGADKFISMGADSLAESQAAAMRQMFGPAYEHFKKVGPQAGQPGLNAVWQDPKMQSPMVQDKLREYLRGQDEGLAQIPSQTTQVGTGIGATVGQGIRQAPTALANGLQSLDTSLTDMGSNFWGNLFGIKPENKIRPTWQDTINQAIEKKKINDAKKIDPNSWYNRIGTMYGQPLR